MKKEFVKLQKLADVTYEGETQESKERWVALLQDNGVTEDYCVEQEGDSFHFSCDELEFVDATVYNFMGSAYADESFYVIDDVLVVRHKESGEMFALYREGLLDC